MVGAVGCACVVLAVAADKIGFGGQAGFGHKQAFLAFAGLVLLIVAGAMFADDRRRVVRSDRRQADSKADGGAERSDVALASARAGASARFREDLEGLRAVAVLLVLLYHAKVPGFSGGYAGVDVFFVLSGFLITGLLLRELETSGRINLAAFYARRLRRILPAALVSLAFTIAASVWLLPPLRVSEVARDGLYAALYASNVRFAVQATDYLQAEVDPSPVLHFWSLGVEEQFYLFWPALVLLTAHRVRRFLPYVGGMILLVTGASFAMSLHLTRANAPWAFFSLPTRAWELGIGGLLAVCARPIGRLPAVGATLLGWIGIGMLILTAPWLRSTTPFPGVAAVLPTIGAAFVIAAGVREPLVAPARALANRLFRFLGRISYSLYLWHWPMLILPVALLEKELSLPVRIAVGIATIPVGAISQRLVEEPIRRGKIVGTVPQKNLLLAAAATSCVALYSLGVARLSSVDIAGTDLPRVYHDGCHLNFKRTQNGTCAYGKLGSEKTIILFGDSHAAQWFPALEALSVENNWRLVSLTKSACPSLDITVYSSVLKRPYNECDEWRENSFSRITVERPALVVVSNARGHVPVRDGVAVGADQRATELAGALRRTVAQLRAMGTAVVVIGDTPKARVNSLTCLSRHTDDPGACATRRAEAVDIAYAQRERRAALGEGAVFIDPTPWVCPGDPCEAVIANQPVYRDDNHLTAAFARSLASRLAPLLPPN